MSKREAQLPREQIRNRVEALLEQCVRRESQESLATYSELKERIICEVTFVRPWKFSVVADLQYPLLLQLFRDAKDNEDLLFRVAIWLKAEQIREPAEFLSEASYKSLTAKARKRMRGFSSSDFYYFAMVQTWLPYTEMLLQQANRLAGRVTDLNRELEDLGFEPTSVKCAMTRYAQGKRWRSPVEFACEWLATRCTVRAAKKRENPDQPSTLRNAHSRINRIARSARCAFCWKPAVGEFEDGGACAFHCEQHRADRLPSSKTQALPDHAGHRWWLQSGRVRCKPSEWAQTT